MQVVLTQDVPNLGKAGEIKDVADSYAHAYLLLNDYAVLPTTSAPCADAARIAQLLNGQTIYFTIRAGKPDPITSDDIAEQIQQRFGLHIDRSMIKLDAPIQRAGVYYLRIGVAGIVVAWLNIVVHNVSATVIEDTNLP